MKNKKGFTLVELLAVIAILAILVLIVLPNVIKLFQKGKKTSFATEAKDVYNAAVNKKLFDNKSVTYNTGDLDITGGKNLNYSISMDQTGKVICFQIQNETYMWTFVSAGTSKKITSVEDVAKEDEILDRDDDLIIDCSNAEYYDISQPGTLTANSGWWTGTTDKSKIERIVISNSYNSKNYDESFKADKEDLGGLIVYVEGNIAYLVNNRHKRNKNAFVLEGDASNTFAGFTNLKTITGLKLVDMSSVTNMDGLFSGDVNLKSLSGIENWNVSNVTSAKNAFSGVPATSLNLSNWDTSSLTNTAGMFNATSASTIDLSGWDVSKVTDFSNMFNGSNAQIILLNGWKTKGDAKYDGMFSNCSKLVSIITSTNFKVNKTDISMFSGDTKLVGQKGTGYSSALSSYAKVDSDDAKGYFTSKVSDGIVSAKLYDKGVSQGNYTELTESGSTPSAWSLYSGSRMLEINLYQLTSGETKTVNITVPAGMYIVEDSWTQKGSNISKVEFVKNTSQGTGSYSNAYTGTLKYTIAASAKSATIKCLVMFDKAIWDKNKANASEMGTDSMTLKAPITVNFNNGSAIRKISNITSAVGVGEGTYGYTYYTYNYNDRIYIGEETTLLSSNQFLANDQSSNPYFYKNVKYEVSAYSKNASGGVITPTIVSATSSNLGTASSLSTTNGKYVAEWNNVYTSSEPYFPRIKYLLDSSTGFVEGNKLTIEMKVTVTTLSGQKRVLSKTLNYTIASKASVLSDIIIGANSHTSPNESLYYDSDYTDVLGSFQFGNRGYEGFNNVKMVYEYDTGTTSGTPKLKVYAARVAAQSGQSIPMKVTLVDNNGTKFGPFTVTFSGGSNYSGLYVSASKVAKANSLTGKYYIKKIEYTLPTLSGTKSNSNFSVNYLYGNQGSMSQSNGGVFIGRVNNTATSTFTFTIDGVGSKTATSTTYSTSKPYYSGNIRNVVLPNGNSYTAGEDFTMKVNVGAVSYPYTNTQAFSKPELYLVLPDGVSIKSAIIASSKDATKAEAIASITKIKSVLVGDALSNVYLVSFNSRVWFGYLVCGDNSADAGSSSGKWINLELSTDNSMDYASFNLRDSLYFKDSNGYISISGSYAEYLVYDKYDVDNNGNTSNPFGTIIDTDRIVTIKEVEE